jgi:hypothetical protein
MMPAAERLLRLYPRAWRERYGEEFLATAGQGVLQLQQVIDIVSGAIDAWLSADVRRAARASSVVPTQGGPMKLPASMVCRRSEVRYTTRDALLGAGVMVATSLLLVALGVAARRAGWAVTGEALTTIGFPVSLTLSMPFWLMKGQPWKAQWVIVGGTVAILLAMGVFAALD